MQNETEFFQASDTKTPQLNRKHTSVLALQLIFHCCITTTTTTLISS